MDFRLTEEQQALRDVSRALLERQADDAANGSLWNGAASLGWFAIAAPEDAGGLGRGLVEMCLVAEQVGHAAASVSFPSQGLGVVAVARWAVERLRDEMLKPLIDGELAAAWAIATPTGRADASLGPQGGALLLSGTKTLVENGADARWLLVAADQAGESSFVVVDVDAPGVSYRTLATLDLTREIGEVVLDDVVVSADRVLKMTAEDRRWLLDAMAVLVAADALGIAERVLDMTLEHVAGREQFGRPLASFQIVKHACSDMRIDVHALRASVYASAMLLDAGTADSSYAAAAAKAFSSEVVPDLASHSLQLHGGMGFTWEHRLHRYLRRAQVDAVLHGDAASHRARLVALAVAGQDS